MCRNTELHIQMMVKCDSWALSKTCVSLVVFLLILEVFLLIFNIRKEYLSSPYFEFKIRRIRLDLSFQKQKFLFRAHSLLIISQEF